MARINKSWFEFKGIRSSDMGVRIIDPFSAYSGMRRGEEEPVAGRNGYVWISDETLEQFDIKQKCHIRKSKKRAVQSWLSGSGALRFSSEEDAQYDARIIARIDFKEICPGDDPIIEFTVTFTVQPDPYIYPAFSPTTITRSGQELETPECAYGLPRVEIYGSGDFSLTIGMETLFFEGIEGGIIVDSELMDALELDGSALLNEKFSGTPYTVMPGVNTVSWLLGDGASIDRVVITPRWRYI